MVSLKIDMYLGIFLIILFHVNDLVETILTATKGSYIFKMCEVGNDNDYGSSVDAECSNE